MQLAASLWSLPWFTAMMHFKSIATFLTKSATEKNSFGRPPESWHLRSANSASTTSPSHWPSSGDVWVRACNVWLPQGRSYSMNAVVHIGKQRLTNLAIVTKFSPLPKPCDNGKTTPCGSVYRAKSVNGEVDGSGHP